MSLLLCTRLPARGGAARRPLGLRWLLPALVLAAGVAAPAQAQRVTARVSTDSARVGDRFTLTLVAEHDPAYEPVFPAVTDSLRLGDLEVLAEQARARYDRGGVRVDSVVYEVTTFALDSAMVPPIPVRFTADGDTTAAAVSAPLQVGIVSLVPPEAGGPRDLKPLVDFPAPVWPWVLLVVGVVLVAGLLAYWFWKRRRERPAAPIPEAPPRVLTPYEEAAERLAALERAAPLRPEEVKPYYVELADLLRHYLARRTGVNALEETTRELVRDLERRALIPADAVFRVRAILDLADFVKFADAHPPDERSRAVVAETRETLDRIEHVLRQSEAVAPREPAEASLANAG